MTSLGIDVLDPDIYAKGVPHESFDRLRREAPVYWHEEPGGRGFWAVTKHHDALQILRDAATFSSEAEGTQIPDLPVGDIRRSPDNLAVMDPPRHTRYRALIGRAFTSQGLSSVEGHVKKLVSSLVSELVERRRFDFVTDFAARLPMAIILNMVGIPQQDETQLNEWVLRLLATDDPEYETTEDGRRAIVQRFMGYAHALAAERRQTPRDDLLSALMRAEVDGAKLTYEEFGMFFMLLLAAGTDTPRLLLGSAMLALMQHPDQCARLRENPSLTGGAVEETLRYHPPFLQFRRTATRDTELRGHRIAVGDKVVVWLVSANRDPDVFVNPDVFDIQRSPNDHVSFGYGPHFCVGNALARLSTKIAVDECIRRMPRLALEGPVERLRSNWFNGMKRMPVVTDGLR
jgi:cholest-4-en-3-one 26-monooxygenase